MRETVLFDQPKFKQLKEAARQSVEGRNINFEQSAANQNEEKIFNLQKEKQLIMKQLKEELKLIDSQVGKIMGSGEINHDIKYNPPKKHFLH